MLQIRHSFQITLPLAFTIHLFNVDTIQGREVTGPDLYWKPSREIWDVIWGIEPTTLNSEHITFVAIDFFSLKIVTKVNSFNFFFICEKTLSDIGVKWCSHISWIYFVVKFISSFLQVFKN